MTTRQSNLARGFTLVEILIVVLILAILAALVVPQFTSATEETRENSLKMNVFRIRQQIEVYTQQHNGHPPTLADFVDQMTQASNAAGDTATPGTPGYIFGPYLREMPPNPFTATATVSNGELGTSAWFYDETEVIFRANDAAENAEF